MKAFQVFWTEPFHSGNINNQPFIFEDFIILCMITSALKWKQLNGPIKLYTDKFGFEIICKHGFLDVWDSIDIKTLDTYKDYEINPHTMWAAGKILALKQEEMPTVMLDTDLMVFDKIDKYINPASSVMGFHYEAHTLEYYLPKEKLGIPEGYEFNSNLDWNINPINTALTYFNDKEIVDSFINESIRFMTKNKSEPQVHNIALMVFAEQRLLAMCSHKLEKKVDVFTNMNDTKNYIFYHLWGDKYIYRMRPELKHNFCMFLINILLDEFNMVDILSRIPSIAKYLNLRNKEGVRKYVLSNNTIREGNSGTSFIHLGP